MTSFLRHSTAHDTHHPSVELEDVSVRYDGAVALAGVSLRLNRGDLAAVVGPNGAGKSTLFNVIAGAIRPATGQVRIYGSGPAGHICVAYVPQRRHVDWGFPVNVHDVVMMGRIGKMGFFRWPGRRDHQVVQAALADVGMSDFSDRQIGELSGGQQQRVFLARALAQEAEVVLLDEPLTGLDAPSQEIMLRLVAELHGRGITILVATHDLQQAADQFPLVALLNRRLVAFGPPLAVLTTTNLLQAYGGQMRVVHTDTGDILLTDTCCGGGEALAIPGELGSPSQP